MKTSGKDGIPCDRCLFNSRKRKRSGKSGKGGLSTPEMAAEFLRRDGRLKPLCAFHVSMDLLRQEGGWICVRVSLEEGMNEWQIQEVMDV